MRQFQIIFFLLSSLILFVSCGSLCNLHHYHQTQKVDIKNDKVLGNYFSSLLYKANLNVYGHSFSGLILFKRIKEDSATHVVFLSELGLNFLDLKYKNNQMELISCNDFLNKKNIIKLLKKDFGMLLQNMSLVDNYKIYHNEKDTTNLLKFKSDKNKYYYFYRSEFDVFKIKQKSGLIGNSIITLNHNIDRNVNEIMINHSNLNIQIELNLIQVKNE